ncbi:excinuclease ABC subunit UvrC [Granulicoccus phenolivorans]|uniref:excinuclease ABC subunit UvrC n=1 Tax=Granulicoccus phenolivorans TaxID=266854 RepID=UPI00041ABFE8|nr:excinuclease ABC subunit UvrC [Granulicoccus phenolivorans]
MADPSTYRPAPGAIPTSPGVYRFRDEHGVVIYVGKAINLRSRLNSYFADLSSLHERTRRMVTTAAKVEWTVVGNEVEALQLEYSWIKEYDPRFNVKYRDDKSYPWLAITWSEEFPRVFVGRGAKRKGTRYFGPYGQAWAIRETVDLLLRVFPMRSCSKGTFNNAQRSGRPCLLGYIDKCSAPCVGRISAEDHRAIVEDFSQFMGGHATHLIRRLETRMQLAADDLNFELAAKYRDDIAALTKAMERNAVVLGDGTDADVIALAEDPLEAAVQIFHVRGGRIRGERGWVADRVDDAGTAELIETFLAQLYVDAEPAAIPREVLLPELPASAEAIADMLSERRGGRVQLRAPQRGDKRTLLDTVARNAAETLIRHKTKRASDLTTRNRALAEIAEALGLPEAPLRIECYDISHLQGTEVVASMVVFEDGLPRKSEYRRFIIKGFEGQNDVAAMHEVITRRFRRLHDDRAALAARADLDAAAAPTGETGADTALLVDPQTGKPIKFAYAPALVVVDGAQSQAAAAQDALDELGISKVAVCGLAKRLEEVWLPDDEYPVILPRTSEGLYLLQRVRDEAHRFAITHHRGRRSRAMVESALDDVPGLGEVRRKALLKEFGSLKKLRAATAEEIAALPGFGPRTAEAVVAALAGQQPQPAVNVTTGEVLG